MNRQDAATRYASIRAEMRRHLDAAPGLATKEEFHAGAEALGLLHDETIVADDDDLSMLADAVLFMPDADGHRVIDRYLGSLTGAREVAFVRRMAKSMFSVWSVVGKHPAGGILVDDTIGRRKRRHVMDHGLEKSAAKGMELGLRLFDAGPFSCAFGIVVPVAPFEALLLRATAPPPDLLAPLLYMSKLHNVSVVELVAGFTLKTEAA